MGEDHPETLGTAKNLADCLLDLGNSERALILLEDVLRLRKEKLGADHPETLTSMNSLANAYRATGQFSKAIALYEELLPLSKAKFGVDGANTLGVLHNLAGAYALAGQFDKALPLHLNCVDVTRAKLGPTHPHTLGCMNDAALAYEAAGELENALLLLQEAAVAMEEADFRHLFAPRIVGNLVRCQEELNRFGAAETWRRKWLERVKDHAGADSLPYANAMAALGWNLIRQEKWVEADTVFRESLALSERMQPDAWTTFDQQSMLGGAMIGQEKYADAEPLLLSGYRGLKQREQAIPPQLRTRLMDALARLVQLYHAIDRPDEAARWQKELDEHLEDIKVETMVN